MPRNEEKEREGSSGGFRASCLREHKAAKDSYVTNTSVVPGNMQHGNRREEAFNWAWAAFGRTLLWGTLLGSPHLPSPLFHFLNVDLIGAMPRSGKLQQGRLHSGHWTFPPSSLKNVEPQASSLLWPPLLIALSGFRSLLLPFRAYNYNLSHYLISPYYCIVTDILPVFCPNFHTQTHSFIVFWDLVIWR